MAHSQEAQDALARIEMNVQAFKNSDEYKKFLKGLAQFHKYSFSNVMWLSWQAAMRDIEPRKFAGFNTWQALGRQVRKGSKSFSVLAPIVGKREVQDKHGTTQQVPAIFGFKIKNSTFEYSQTDPIEGKDAWEPLELPELTDNSCTDVFDRLIDLVKSNKITVKVVDNELGSAYGSYNPALREMKLRTSGSVAERVGVVIHELAHALVRDLDIADYNRNQEEVVVESVAYAVAAHYGVDLGTQAFMYIGTWIDEDMKGFKSALKEIQKLTDHIITALDSDTAESEAA